MTETKNRVRPSYEKKKTATSRLQNQVDGEVPGCFFFPFFQGMAVPVEHQVQIIHPSRVEARCRSLAVGGRIAAKAAIQGTFAEVSVAKTPQEPATPIWIAAENSSVLYVLSKD